MCGIAGFWSPEGGSVVDLKLMTDAIIHRGPDGEGHWLSSDNIVGLGHRRLSIIDLSKNASQPMGYENRFILTFNGEIYNYIELKKILEQKGARFRTVSDSEVLLAAYAEWGTACLNYLDGMFAFAIYDIHEKKLFCARDRFGEKPFYYTFYNGNLYFASEMKAFWILGISKEIDNGMVYNFLANDLVENPNDQSATFYSNIKKLKNSSYFVYSGGSEVVQYNYWKIDLSYLNDMNFRDASIRYRELLDTSLSRRLRSDVPVGTSLSGGLDSSSVVALVSKKLEYNHTFSARFMGFARDEGKFINIVANHFKTIHHDVFLDAQMFYDSLEKLIYHQEEPFQTGSIFAQYKVYEAAREHNIVVMLDGQGADEYLCGYDKDFSLLTTELFPNAAAICKYQSQIRENHGIDISFPFKNLLAQTLPLVYKTIRKYRDSKIGQAPLGINQDFHAAYKPSNSPFHTFGTLRETLKHEVTNQGLEKLLKFADRNSMAHSVEVRLPFLYHELVEFVLSLNCRLLINDGWSKAILRKSMENVLPNEIRYRKDKIGFEAPTKDWAGSNILIDEVKSTKRELIGKGLITDYYTDNWKLIILGRTMKN